MHKPDAPAWAREWIRLIGEEDSMKDLSTEAIKDCILDGLREMHRRVKDGPDFRSLVELYMISGFFKALIYDLENPET